MSHHLLSVWGPGDVVHVIKKNVLVAGYLAYRRLSQRIPNAEPLGKFRDEPDARNTKIVPLKTLPS